MNFVKYVDYVEEKQVESRLNYEDCVCYVYGLYGSCGLNYEDYADYMNYAEYVDYVD